MKNNPLLDTIFLKQLDQLHTKEIFARIISLNFNEQPIEEITGKVTGGSINIDGNSAVRRTCSITIVAENVNITDFYWSLTHKFKLEIGVKNNINTKDYDEIIWFPQGVYVISSFSTNEATNNYTINISGKDKMVFLNGEFGGVFPQEIEFDVWEQLAVDDSEKELTKTKIPVAEIIRNLVHVYGNESYHNIIIKDLEDTGLEMIRWQGRTDDTRYFIKPINDNNNSDVYLTKVYTKDELGIGDDFVFDNGVNTINNEPSVLTLDGKEYLVKEVVYGTEVGYRLCDLIYDESLVGKVGENAVSILDKIKKKFGAYEYFYNLDGQFVFQKAPNYFYTSWNNIKTNDENEVYVEAAANTSSLSYTFADNNIITSFANQPNIANIKNDFSVWGELSGNSSVPIHMRYAIDVKPQSYTNLNGVTYIATDDYKISVEDNIKNVDWREVLYQMALDYFNHNGDDNFEFLINQNNNGKFLYGRTGYEQYYIDLLTFWRGLYNEESGWIAEKINHPENLIFWFDFLETGGELQKYSVPSLGARLKAASESALHAIHHEDVPLFIYYTQSDLEELYIGRNDGHVQRTGLKKMYEENKFWQADLEELTSQGIDIKLACLILYIRQFYPGYTPVEMSNFDSDETHFVISTEGVSIKEQIDTYIYNYAGRSDSITISCLPIYYLDPNTRIRVSHQNTGISGDYIISKITIPLAYNGTMSITATRAMDHLY